LIASLAKLARRGSRSRCRLLRRRSGTKSVSPRSSSARRRAIRLWLPRSPSSLRADRALGAAYFVVAPGRKTCPLAPPQHGGARSEFDCLAGQARCVWWLAALAAMFAG